MINFFKNIFKDIFKEKYVLNSNDFDLGLLYVVYKPNNSYQVDTEILKTDACLFVNDFLLDLYNKKSISFVMRSVYFSSWRNNIVNVKSIKTLDKNLFFVDIDDNQYILTTLYTFDIVCNNKNTLANIKLRCK